MPTMIETHTLRSREFWQSNLQRVYQVIQTMAEQERQDIRLRADLERQAGLIHRFLGEPGDTNLLAACEYGAALALLRTLQQRSMAFQVRIEQSDNVLLLPGDRNVDFGWPNWLDSYSLAVLLNHEDALSILSTAECIDACALPPENVDRFWPFLCGAFATLAQNDPIGADLINDAEGFMQKPAIMDTHHVEACYSPLLEVMRAIIDRNQSAFTDATAQALNAFHQYYRDTQDGDAEATGLYHLHLSALVEHGRRVGLELAITSDALLPPAGEGLATHMITAMYPILAILDALEAEWFMELEGFAWHTKSVIHQDDSQLLAAYFAKKRPGIPHAELNFELLQEMDNPYGTEHFQPALDVGQLIQIAEILAGTPQQNASGETVYRLEEAVTAIDLALKYIQRMGGQFKPATLHSHLGQSLYESEPGRFNPERLLVYRNALASQTNHPPKTAVGTGNETTAKEQVFAMIEELKPHLLPILQAIATDQSGDFIKSLQPTHDDYAKVFSEDLAEIAEQHYADWWQQPLLQMNIDEEMQIDAFMAPAGMLTFENELSYHFPNGYKSVAEKLNPHRVWVCWKYHPVGETTGYSLNGMVWIDDHWAWFPKPYKIEY